MNTTYSRLTSRRAWYVPGVSVHGDLQTEAIDAIGTESDAGTTRVVYYRFTVGGQAQELPYASLTDHRGNLLPAVISRPVVILIPRNDVAVAVVGLATDTACRLAKTAITAADGVVDLWIVEAGF